jgi:hypothetical protein
MKINRDDIKSIQSDISELIYYAKNTSSGNVSHKMPSIMNRLNEIDIKLKNILFSEVDDRTQDEKDIQNFIDMSKEKDLWLPNISKDDIVPTYSKFNMLDFSKWTLTNLKYCYDIQLNTWWERNTFKFKTWEEIFNIFEYEIQNKNNDL